VFSLDDLNLGGPNDPRTKLVVQLLSARVYGEADVTAALQAAGLSPADYEVSRARRTWREAVPDAVGQHKLDALVGYVTESEPAFGTELERQLRLLLAPSGDGGWYRCENPYACGFVGAGAGRAIIDRTEFRSSIYDLATDQYRVLVVTGAPGSGKSHSWLLIDHLREAGKLTGHRCARVTTHFWGTAEVTGEMVAQSLADRLGLDVRLTPSGELPDARARKVLDLLAGQYPDDGVIRWIVLDGLDRPMVQPSAKDVGRQLIRMVSEGELPRTRLVITGLDEGGLPNGNVIKSEAIPAVDRVILRSFLLDAAAHLGREVDPEDLDEEIAEILGTSEAPHSLSVVEAAVVGLVRDRWGAGGQHGS
jgi:hypothetical protein